MRTCWCRCTRSSPRSRLRSPGGSSAVTRAHGSSGPIAWPLAAFVLWTGLTLAWSIDVRKGAIFLAAFILPFCLLTVGFARLPWRGRWLTWLWAALVGTALAYALRGRLPVGAARRLLEPGGDRRQRLRAVLPRQLGVLGSVDLRPLPRRRDPRDADRRSPRRRRALEARRALRRGRRHLGRSLPLVLAVELRRPGERRRRRDGGRLGASRGRRARRARSCSSAVASLGFPSVRHELVGHGRSGANASRAAARISSRRGSGSRPTTR